MVKGYKGPDVPLIGPWLGRIGHVADILATPCSVEPEIWVLAFWSGVPNAVWSLFKPDPFDSVTERFGRPHHRKGHRRFRIEDRLLGGGTELKGYQWNIFRLGELAQRIGWYFAIIDAATELSVHWSSMAYQWSGCRSPGNPSAKIIARYGAVDYGAGGYIDNMEPAWEENPLITSTRFIYVPNGITASTKFNCKVGRNTLGLPQAQQVQIQLRDVIAGRAMQPWDFNPGRNGDETRRDIFREWQANTGAHQYQVYVSHTPGWFSLEIDLEVNGLEDRGILGDP